MAQKLITAENLAVFRNKMMEQIAGNVREGGSASFSSVSLSSNDTQATLSYDADSESVVLSLPGDVTTTLAVNGSTDMKTVRMTAPELSTSSDASSDGKRTVYCLPTSPLESRIRATSIVPTVDSQGEFTEYGGGVILTTKSRSYTKITNSLVPDEAFDAVAYCDCYCCYNDVGGISITLDELNSGKTTEYWLELHFTDTLIPAGETATSPVVFTNNQSLFWAGGEPNWAEMAGHLVQIHIMNNIATWVDIAPTTEQ